MRLVRSEAAERDLANIFDYTYGIWGADQADRYLRSLESAFDRLLAHPLTGHPTEIDGFNYRRLRHQSHFIFFRVEKDEVLVDRILHQRMDAARHL